MMQGNIVMKGYLKNPRATKPHLLADGSIQATLA